MENGRRQLSSTLNSQHLGRHANYAYKCETTVKLFTSKRPDKEVPVTRINCILVVVTASLERPTLKPVGNQGHGYAMERQHAPRLCCSVFLTMLAKHPLLDHRLTLRS